MLEKIGPAVVFLKLREESVRISVNSARILFCAVFVTMSLFVQADLAESSNDTGFDAWLMKLKIEAAEKGISEHTISSALGEVRFIERVIKSDRAQAEFKETYQEYISKRVSEYRVKAGRKYMSEYGNAVANVTETYGVPARFVVSIIGVETNYGTFKLSHSLFDVLATLAYDKRRGARFRKEIFAALQIIDSGDAHLEQLKSSWAGALGIPQFMPSTYLQFAQDADGDGTRNIWEHGPDLWASVAKYLSHYGWNMDQAWARKVLVPLDQRKTLPELEENIVDIPKDCKRYHKHLKGWNKLQGWDLAGVRRMNGLNLPNAQLPASMILTDPDRSHAYLVYENFCTLMRYNPSFKYALSVGVLSDNLK